MMKSYSERRTRTSMPSATLCERPDQAVYHLTASVETDTAAAALPLLKRAAQRLEEVASSLQATSAVTHIALPQDFGKLDSAASSLHATLTVPLSREASTWDRAAKLAQVDDLLRVLVHEGKKQKPKIEVQRAAPVFMLAEPEAHRATLVQRLHERARSLGGGQPVQLRELRFDQPVEQHSLGLEQVELSLKVEGVAEVLLGQFVPVVPDGSVP